MRVAPLPSDTPVVPSQRLGLGFVAETESEGSNEPEISPCQQK